MLKGHDHVYDEAFIMHTNIYQTSFYFVLTTLGLGWMVGLAGGGYITIATYTKHILYSVDTVSNTMIPLPAFLLFEHIHTFKGQDIPLNYLQ